MKSIGNQLLVGACVILAAGLGYYAGLLNRPPAQPIVDLVPRAARLDNDGLRSTNADVVKNEDAKKVYLDALSALREPNLTDRYLGTAKILEALTPANWRAILDAFEVEKKAGRRPPELWALFVRKAGESVGREAFLYFLNNDTVDAARNALSGWATTQPVDALEWLGSEANPEVHRKILGAAIRGLAASEPDLAIRALEGIPLERRHNYTNNLVSAIARGAGLDRTEALLLDMVKRADEQGIGDKRYLKNLYSDFANIKLSQSALQGDLGEVSKWILANANSPYLDLAVVRSTAQHVAASDPQAALQWLENVRRAGDFAQGTALGYSTVLATWIDRAGTLPAEAWLASNSSLPSYDQIVTQYVTLIAGRNKEEAIKWASTIKDSVKRMETINRISNISSSENGK